MVIELHKRLLRERERQEETERQEEIDRQLIGLGKNVCFPMCGFLYQLVIRWVEFRKKNRITIASSFVPTMQILNGAMYKADD